MVAVVVPYPGGSAPDLTGTVVDLVVAVVHGGSSQASPNQPGANPVISNLTQYGSTGGNGTGLQNHKVAVVALVHMVLMETNSSGRWTGGPGGLGTDLSPSPLGVAGGQAFYNKEFIHCLDQEQ